MNIRFAKNTIVAFVASLFLCYVLITTKDLLTRLVVIPFLMFGISFLVRNICLVLKKNRIAKKASIVTAISFFLYYFGFLICWDYIAIANKDYISVLFSLLAWFGGIFFAYRRYLRLKS